MCASVYEAKTVLETLLLQIGGIALPGLTMQMCQVAHAERWVR